MYTQKVSDPFVHTPVFVLLLGWVCVSFSLFCLYVCQGSDISSVCIVFTCCDMQVLDYPHSLSLQAMISSFMLCFVCCYSSCILCFVCCWTNKAAVAKKWQALYKCFFYLFIFFIISGNVRWLEQCANIKCVVEVGKIVHETVQMLTGAYDDEAVKILNWEIRMWKVCVYWFILTVKWIDDGWDTKYRQRNCEEESDARFWHEGGFSKDDVQYVDDQITVAARCLFSSILWLGWRKQFF